MQSRRCYEAAVYALQGGLDLGSYLLCCGFSGVAFQIKRQQKGGVMTAEERGKKAQELIEKIREQGLIEESGNYSGHEDLLAVLEMVINSVFLGSPRGRPGLTFE
jgi:hypothetical protein